MDGATRRGRVALRPVAESAESCSSPSRLMAASMSLPQTCSTSVITCEVQGAASAVLLLLTISKI